MGVQDWQFGLKLKASMLTVDDLSGSKPEKIWFKAKKNSSSRTASLGYYVVLSEHSIWEHLGVQGEGPKEGPPRSHRVPRHGSPMVL